MSVRVSIVGLTGYTGQELLRLCLRHPAIEVASVHASASTAATGATAGEVAPFARGVCDLPVRHANRAEILSERPDAVFLALPHEVSAGLAGELVDDGTAVLDLSGAYRLHAGDYPTHYGFEHPRPDLLEAAVYGLVELPGVRERLAAAPLVAVPGCYTTASILALAPLHAGGLADERAAAVIDAMSGVSGAGRSPTVDKLFCDVGVRPYKVLNHRHQPEIERYAAGPARRLRVRFVPHVGPWDRGIVATCHVPLRAGVRADDARGAFKAAYGYEPFVRLLPEGAWPSTLGVGRTNFVDLGLMVDEEGGGDDRGHAVVCAAIDNLTKGAAGQAVQCMNIRFGLLESEGLL